MGYSQINNLEGVNLCIVHRGMKGTEIAIIPIFLFKVIISH